MHCCAVAERGHSRAEQLINGARACLGARFRPLGRGPDAYDCLGVVLAAAAAASVPLDVPCGYDLRWVEPSGTLAALMGNKFAKTEAPAPGDLLWHSAGGRQHFQIWIGAGVIEADAGLRRVVQRPAATPNNGWRFPGGD